MNAILQAIHDIWCAVTGRCRVSDHGDDPLMQTLRHHERAARREAEASRRRQHFMEEELLARLHRMGEGHARHD